MQINSSGLKLLVPLGAIVLCLTGCFNPRSMPGFRDMAKQEGDRITRESEEAIKSSPVLKELDYMCGKTVPILGGSVLTVKSADFKKKASIDYSYNSRTDEQGVRDFYKNYFSQSGWQLSDQKDGGWGARWLKFRKDDYEVTVYHGGLGEGNYSLYCKKILDSADGESNSK